MLPLPPPELLPTMYDLPSEEPGSPGLPDFQGELLRQTFQPPNYPSDRIFVASNLNLYYDPHHPQCYKRLDWFAVLGIPSLYQGWYSRSRYVVWFEKVAPLITVELLSQITKIEDSGQTWQSAHRSPSKWEVCEQIVGIPYYLVLNCDTDEWQAFGLVAGRYQPLNISPQGLWLPEAQLGLGLWRRTYQGIDRLWLRWYDAFGNWIPTPEEQERQRAEQERIRAQQAEQRAQQAEQQAQRLAERLRAMGVNLEDDEML